MTAIASLRSAPALVQVERGDHHDLVAVDELARARRPRARGRRHRRTRARRRRPLRRPSRCSSSGMRRTARGVDVPAVGFGVQHVDLGAERPRTRAAPTSEAAPFAQSSTTRRPSRRRPSSAATRCSTYGVGCVASSDHVGPRFSRGTGRFDAARCELRFDRGFGVVVELAAAGANNLMPLSVHGLWLAEIISAGQPSAPREEREARGGQHARVEHASRPRRRRPARRSSTIRGPDSRVSRPTTNGASAPSTRAAARPSATTSSEVRSASASPRMPSVPKRE